MSEFERYQKKWVAHSCNVKGCKECYCTIDGNEKLRRSICANGGNKTLNDEGLNIQDCCPEDPEIGGKYRKPNRFCSKHKDVNETDKDTTEISEYGRSERNRKCPIYLEDFVTEYGESSIEKMMKVDEEVVSCKDKKKVNKVYKTSAGMYFAIRPCRLIVSCEEMYSHESLIQSFIFLRNVFCENDSRLMWLRYLGYDRSCEWKPFIHSLAEKVPGAQQLLNEVECLVDIFHVVKHTKPCCMPFHDNPQCKYHPKLEKI